MTILTRQARDKHRESTHKSHKRDVFFAGKPLIGTKSTLTGNCSTTDLASWALHAGDPLYNVKNPCCLAWNAPGPWGSYVVVTDFAQAQIEQLVATAAGREAYVTFVRLLTRCGTRLCIHFA